jgi:PhnB protein
MSNLKLFPYVNFQGRAREALEFYHELLGGKLDMYTFSEKGAKPAGVGDRIMYARFEAEGVVIVGSDGRPGHPAIVGDNVAFALHGTDKDRITRIFDGLRDGGEVKLPLTQAPWGTDGWLTDKFGITWNIAIDNA